tara:strand:+ start:140 stop:601 length:462 start_codon:yes stop_codon:yes gene_type:complete
MKKSTHLFLALTVLFFTISCKNTPEKKPVQEQPQQTEEQHHNRVEELKLNNGNLWEANAETTEGVNNMIVLLTNFSEKENIEAYATLKQNLEKEFGTIITKCTMKGEAHNQLHLFLMPMKELFNGLASSNIDTCKESFNELNKHLTNYARFFE